jgi:large conductance mechanosensitive channel
MQNFIQFIREQGVVGLAIGFILGGAVGKVVASLVSDIIMPALAIALGLKALSYMGVNYGAFISTLVDFVIIAAVIYFVFKKIGLDKLDKPKGT